VDEARELMNTETQGEVLQAFSLALQHEMNNLTPHLSLFWQQLYNRLQWEVKGVDARLRRISTGCEMEYNGEHFWFAGNSMSEGFDKPYSALTNQ